MKVTVLTQDETNTIIAALNMGYNRVCTEEDRNAVVIKDPDTRMLKIAIAIMNDSKATGI